MNVFHIPPSDWTDLILDILFIPMSILRQRDYLYVSACHLTQFAPEVASLPSSEGQCHHCRIDIGSQALERMTPCSQFLVYCNIASTDCIRTADI